MKEPHHVKVETVFFENDLYTVLSDRNERSDRNEHRLADKESQWARALRKIRQLVSEGRDGQIEEGDELALALDYYLHAGFRTPEHLDEVMHGGEHTPREVIEKVTEGDLDEAGYNRLEHNIRADLGSGQPDLVKAKIKKFKRTLGSRGLQTGSRNREPHHRKLRRGGHQFWRAKNVLHSCCPGHGLILHEFAGTPLSHQRARQKGSRDVAYDEHCDMERE